MKSKSDKQYEGIWMLVENLAFIKIIVSRTVFLKQCAINFIHIHGANVVVSQLNNSEVLNLILSMKKMEETN